MGIILGKDQRLRHFPPAREQINEQAVFEGLQDRADLVRCNDCAVELLGVVGKVLVE
jgi:hypothetical protein